MLPLVLGAFALSLAASLAMVPAVRRLAHGLGWTDAPDGRRKLHARPIPNVGGVAIAAAFVLAVDLLRLALPDGSLLAALFPPPLIVLGAGLIAAVGLLDDLLDLSHRAKFAAQVAVTALVFASGFRITLLDPLLGDGLAGLAVSGALTLVWMVGVMNAVNLVDGMDGLAGGVTAIAFLGMAGAYAIAGDTGGLLLVAAVVGALLGFLRYNFHPASIFMGDSGSLFLGFLLAAYGLRATGHPHDWLGLVISAVAMGLPVLDTLVSMGRRFVRGLPLFHPDRDHIHHRLARRLSHRNTVLVLYAAAAFFALGAMGMAAVPAWPAMGIFAVGSLAVLAFMQSLGYLPGHGRLRPLWQEPVLEEQVAPAGGASTAAAPRPAHVGGNGSAAAQPAVQP